MDVALVIIGAVVKIAIPLLSAEIAKRGINGENDATGVGSLLKELEHIEAAIKKHRNDTDPLINVWIKNLTCFAYDIEDCVDDFCAKKITSSGLKTRIAQLMKSACSISQMFQRYNVSSSGSGAPPAPSPSENQDEAPPAPSRSEIGGIVELADPIGILEHLQNLRAAVRSSSSCNRKLKVISIVGFGGTGKTLLADLVYKDAEVRTDFPLGASVRVVGKKKEDVLQEILAKLLEAKNELVHGGASISSEPPQIDNSVYGGAAVPSQGAPYMECLGNDGYIIVLDDVRDTDVGKYIISAFRDPRVQSYGRIILTTTIHKTAEECSSSSWDGHVYKLGPLGIEESKRLFEKAAKVYEVVGGLPEEQSSEFGNKCDGVALALMSIAQFGDGDLSRCQDAWTGLFERRYHHKLAGMQRVLDHTYDGASSLGLREVLLYFSMFPAGHPVRRSSLVRRCLAEGLLTPTAHDEEAERQIKELISLNAIWPIQMSIDDQGTKTCQPPRLLHQYISIKSETEDFIMLSCNDNNNTKLIRRLSLYRDGAADPTHELQKRNLPHLRTLAVSGNKKSNDPPVNFTTYEQLRVLDLESYRPGLQQKQFNEICDKLKLLKYLSLRADNISEVPSNISKLHLLETLDMGNKKVILVPIEIIELPRLKHLIGKFKLLDSLGRKAKELIPRPFKKTSESKLERFSGFVTRKGQGFPSLMCHMTRLKKVKIWFYLDADAKSIATHLPEAITKFLHNEPTVDAASRRSLSLDFQECPSPGKLLDSLAKASGKLYSLKLSGRYTVIREIPSFAARMKGITKLCLSWTQITLKWNDILHGVSTLTELEYLKLQVEEIQGDHPQVAGAGQSGTTVLPVETWQFDKMKMMCLQTENYLPHLKADKGALKNLASLHLICGTLDCLSAQQIAQLEGLKEVTLLSGLDNNTKEAWREAARSHRNVPYVLFIRTA